MPSLNWSEDSRTAWGPDFPKVHVKHWLDVEWHVKKAIRPGQVLQIGEHKPHVLIRMSRSDIINAFRMAWCMSDVPISVYQWMIEAGILERVQW